MSESSTCEPGRIDVICGCMFSGKSERLLARVSDARAQGMAVAVFKHASDDRYAESQIVTHSGRRGSATPLSSATRMQALAGDAALIVIDEAQFFGDDLVDLCRQFRDQDRKIVVAGLDLDSWGLPFGPMPELEAIADRVTRTHAVCSVCGSEADHTQRLAAVESQEMVGGAEAYEPRCANCFEAPPLELRR